MFQVLKAAALTTFYPIEYPWGGERDIVMSVMKDGTICQMTNDRQIQILDLMRDISERRGMRNFYDIAAANGFTHLHDLVLEAWPGDKKLLINYFLLCSIPRRGLTRNEEVNRHFLEMGADPS